MVQEWEARGRQLAQQGIHVADLADAYLEHYETYYRRKDGSPTGETENIADCLAYVLELDAETPVEKFGIENLLAIRNRLVRGGSRPGLARGTVNSYVGRIVTMVVPLGRGDVARSASRARRVAVGRALACRRICG